MDKLSVAREVYWQYLERIAAEMGMVLDPTKPAAIKRGDCDREHGVQIALAALAQPAPDGERWRPEVVAFADLMEAQLRANDHKPGWKDDLACDLIPRLREESVELEEATNRHAKRVSWGDGWVREETAPAVGREAADVANFAMMIADVCGALTPAPQPAEGAENDVQFEIWQDDMMVAAADVEADARHYLAVYAQDKDGPVRLVRAETRRTTIAEAIMGGADG